MLTIFRQLRERLAGAFLDIGQLGGEGLVHGIS